MALWMNQGKINLTLNSKNVVGVGTAFLTSAVPARPGQPLVVNGVMMEIASVDSDTALTLAQNYTGATASNLNYFIMTTMEGSYNDLARRAAQVMGAYQGYMNLDVYQELFTGTGMVLVTLPDGSQYSLPAWGNTSAEDLRYQRGFLDLTTEDLNSLTVYGEYRQAGNANATLARNYPVASKAGTLEYRRGAYSGVMVYTTLDGVQYTRASSATGWTNGWQITYSSVSKPNISDVIPGTMAGAMTVANMKSALKVNNQTSISYQDQSGTIYHDLVVGNNKVTATGLAGTTILETLDPSGNYSVSGYVSAGAHGGRGWNSYGIASYKVPELTAVAGTIRSVLSAPFKINGAYALDIYIGQYAGSNLANESYQMFAWTDGGSYNKGFVFGANGQIAHKTDNAWTTGTILSASPMTGPSFTPTSDSRLKPKELRQELSEVSDVLRQFKPKYYFKKYAIDSKQGFYEFGFIADEIEQVEPRLVFETNDEHHLKHLVVNGITAHLVKGWQEHDERLGAVETLLQDIDKRLKNAGI